mmetsp:Transcript_126805/g.353158  ORF Transcript_126805/g.353158 Transcript_126805/m.353158 type:complete len:492 (-) Transcript_126805:80-1555(-)
MFFRRKKVVPVCLGPPGFAGLDDQDGGRSTLMATGEMVVTPTGASSQARRRSIDLVSQHLKSNDRTMDGVMTAGPVVTKHSARQHMLVVRGPHWKWGDDDGGAGRPGRILTVDKKSNTITVFWHHTDHVHAYYRCGKYCDLSMAAQPAMGTTSCPASVVSASSAQECVDEDPATAESKPSRRWSLRLFPRRTSVSSLLSTGSSIPASISSRRSSQADFSLSTQTFIVFDWDDTLFPTSYFSKGLGVNPTIPLKDQKRLAPSMRPLVGRGLMKAADSAVRLLRMASTLGKVVLVTLADNPWVELTCRSSYPAVGQVLKELGIKVVYAKEVCKDKLKRGDNESELFWSKIKGECIAQEATEFYSQYEGQSWKNIMSIGDSQFERLGTMVTTSEYMREKGMMAEHDEVDDHDLKVRTKTLKMVSEPTLEELTSEIDLLIRWLPLMVNKDCSLDIVIDDLDNSSQVKDIEEMLMSSSDTQPPQVVGFAATTQESK